MGKIEYLKGDATKPIGNGNKIIVHVCNDIGGWGKGFVLAISNKWSAPEKKYREWYKEKNKFALGETQIVQVEENIFIANMIGQSGIKKTKDKNNKSIPPIRYNAIEEALEKVAEFAVKNNATVHMPRIGCGLAGGKWEYIEPILMKTLSSKKINSFVYDF